MRIRFGVVLLFVVLNAPLPAIAQPDPEHILSAARQALGGDAALSAVGSFVVSGSANRKIGDRVVDQVVEIAYQAPDRFVRTVSYDAMVGGPFGLHLVTTTREGLRGPNRIYRMTMEGSSVQPPAPPANPAQRDATERAALRRQHQAFARLSLALFAASEPGYPLSFSSLGRVTLPDGATADALEGRAEDGDVIRLFLDAASHLPVAVSWREVSGFVSSHEAYADHVSSGVNGALRTLKSGVAGVGGGPERKDGTPAASDSTGPLPIAEHTWELSEYRTADGLNWPHRFVERVDGKVVEELTLGRFKLNPKIPDEKFRTADPAR